MKKVSRVINGRLVSIEIEENDFELLLSTKDERFISRYFLIVHEEQLQDRAETRRHQSLDYSMNSGFDVADSRENIEMNFINSEQSEVLHNALFKLLPEQRELIKKIYIDKISVTQIAAQENVSQQAISDRLKKILKKLKLFLI